MLVLAFLGCGAAVACAAQDLSDPGIVFGIALASLSTLAGAAGVVFSALLLNGDKASLSPLSLLQYMAPTQLLLLLLVWPLTEMRPFVAWARRNSINGLGYLLGGTLLAFVLQLVTFKLVRCLGAVSSSLLGNAKSVITISVAAAFMGAPVSAACTFGYVATVLAGCAYTALNALERYAEQSAPLRKSRVSSERSTSVEIKRCSVAP